MSEKSDGEKPHAGMMFTNSQTTAAYLNGYPKLLYSVRSVLAGMFLILQLINTLGVTIHGRSVVREFESNCKCHP